MPYLQKETITNSVIPFFIKACKDEIPNVRFSVCIIIKEKRQYIDANVYSNQIVAHLKELANDNDKDVAHFSSLALTSAN